MAKQFEMTGSMRRGTAMLKKMLRFGLPMGPLVLLSVRGRKTGTTYSTPVAVVRQNGSRWLVAAFGEVNWVHNIRAAGQADLLHGRRPERIKVVELGAAEAAPILKQFLEKFQIVPFIRPYFDTSAKSPITAFEREAIYHPVFRIISSD